jgi:hypothetical protein
VKDALISSPSSVWLTHCGIRTKDLSTIKGLVFIVVSFCHSPTLVLLSDPTIEMAEKWVRCPYNPTHKMPEARLQWHLVKCADKVNSSFPVVHVHIEPTFAFVVSSQHPLIWSFIPQKLRGDEYATCPFNAQHVVLKSELSHHKMRCPDRVRVTHLHENCRLCSDIASTVFYTLTVWHHHAPVCAACCSVAHVWCCRKPEVLQKKLRLTAKSENTLPILTSLRRML